MAIIEYRKKRTRQPQRPAGINWKNSLTRDLLVSLPSSSGSGYTSLGQNKVAGVATAASTGTTPVGTALKLSATGHIALGTACLLPSATTPFTMALYELPDATSAYSSLVGLSGASAQWLWIRGTDPSYVCTLGRANNNSATVYAGVGAQVAGVPHRFLITSSGGIESLNGYRVWMDGVEQTGVSNKVFGAIASGTNYIGWDGADTKFNGKLQDFNLWGRVLSDAEIQEYFRAPYQIFAPRTIPIPVSAGGGGTHATTGALTGQGSTVAGSAAHIAIHGTSGTLEGPGSEIVGSAARTRAHPTSGALVGPGSVIDGAADHIAAGGPHETSGALVGQGSVIAGSAAHIAKHATSGELVGQGSTLAGDAARVAGAVTHATTGELVGQGSIIVGAARGPQIDAVVTGGGGWLPSMRRKTRKQIHDERVRLGILPADVVKAAKKAAAVVADEPAPVMAYKADPEQANKVFMRSLGVSKMLTDYTRAIEAQIKVRQQEEEDLMLFM